MENVLGCIWKFFINERFYGVNIINTMKNIQLTYDEVLLCKRFAFDSAKSQQPIEFGNQKTVPRKVVEIARDNVIGKLAEMSFSKFLKNEFDKDIFLDFNIYPRGVWDTDDFNIDGKSIDVKSTRSGGKWLLVELSKLEFRKKENKLPFAFLFAIVGWDRIKNTPTGLVTLSGFANIEQICNVDKIGIRDKRICSGIEGTQFLMRGECIPNTTMRLQADNCARHSNCLDVEWSKLIT